MTPRARLIILCYMALILAVSIAATIRHGREAARQAALEYQQQRCAAALHGYDPEYSPQHVKEACE